MPDLRRSTYLLGGQIYADRCGGGPDALVAGLASRQHGVVARRQLLDLGLGERVIDRRLSRGSLRRLYSGVYAAGHDALSYPARVTAAVMAVTGEAAASHLSAAALHDIADPPSGPIHVTSTQPRRPRSGIVIHRPRLPAEEIEIVHGIPTTTVARTLLDLSGRIDHRRLRRLVKEAEFRDLVSMRVLAEILEAHPRRPGRRALAQIVGSYVDGSRRTRSELEDRFLEFCAARHLPRPETNVVLQVRGKSIEVDCLWREARLIVELDGWRAHGRESAFQDDRARDRSLIAAGYAPMRITWAQLAHDAARVDAEIRAALARSAAPA